MKKKTQPLLCFIHGWACSPNDFREQQSYFTTFPTLALDYTSNPPNQTNQTSAFRSCSDMLLAQLIEAAKGQPVVVIAHSLGGILSLAWLHNPKISIKGMIIIDSTLNMDETRAQAYQRLSELIQAENAASTLDAFFEAKMTNHEMDDATTMQNKKQEMLDACLSDPGYFSALLQEATTASTQTLSEASLPVLYVGSSSPFTSKHELEEINPHIEFKHIPHSGHFVMLNAPVELNHHIETFLTKIS